jgi:exportin-1
MPEKEERSFFITTLRNLLQLCESKKGKENKAVIASCIMYVVGQYPTFLKVNWNFLKTVIRKLFEFMREDYPGIMEMACNAFLKICKNTSEQFTRLQQG